VRRATLSLLATVAALAAWSAPALAAGAPSIELEAVSSVEFSSATLSAKINPQEAPTRYRFEYGPDTSYGTSLPASEAPAGSGSETVTVKQLADGLTAGSTYHYRLVAVSSEGTTYGPDKVFRTFAKPVAEPETCPNAGIRTTQFATGLPDCRAYEMVSPLNKNGGNVAADPTMTQAAVNGDAVKYTSTAAFAGATGMEARGAEYLSRRSADGWSTNAINPNQAGPLYPIITSEYVYFAEDLSKGVYLALSPVGGGHPNVENVPNLYLRNDVLSGAPGNYELLSDSASSLSGQPPLLSLPIDFAAASKDMSRIFFESTYNLTSEASGLPEGPKAYEWHNGSVSLVGVLPNGQPAENSLVGAGAGAGRQAGMGNTLTQDAISTDGSRVVYIAPPIEGSRTGWEGFEGRGGQLYMRVNGTETLYLTESERLVPDARRPLPAVFWAATPDESKVFFTTEEALTDDASEEGMKYYMYDVNAGVHKHLKLLAAAAMSPNESAFEGAINGVSPDGSYVYFSTAKPIRPQDPIATYGYPHGDAYVWHDGQIRFITSRGASELGEAWNEYSLGVNSFRISRDGKEIAFVNEDPLTVEAAEGDKNPYPNFLKVPQVFVYRYDTNKLYCASCNPSGAYPTGAGFSNYIFSDANSSFLATGSNPTGYLSRALTEDGQYVFFDTVDALVPQDVNSQRDVYMYDTLTGKVRLISGGICGCGSFFVDASPNGHDVFFTTYQKLVHSDIDSNADLYDARVEGGLTSQNEPISAVCTGDDCQGPASSAPSFSLPASVTFAGVGNPAVRTVKAKPKRVVHKAHRRKQRVAKHRRGRSTHKARRNVSHRVGR
jgi:hypothetical protein